MAGILPGEQQEAEDVGGALCWLHETGEPLFLSAAVTVGVDSGHTDVSL